MRIFEINVSTNGSTGKIMFGIADAVEAVGGTVMCAAPIVPMNKGKKSPREFVQIGTYYSRHASNLISMATGRQGYTAYFATKKLLKQIDGFKPDVIHLHNLHSNYINLPLLFGYIKKHNVPTVWTLHDCWSMTAQCPHFVMAGCDKWKTGCHDCTQLNVYPRSFVDNTKNLWKKKREWFTGVSNMTLVTPSKWMASVVKASYLKDYPVQVVYNGIDLNVFKPEESNFREKYNLTDKKILLGVAFDWGKRKGLDVFVELSKRLSDEYRIVLVGTNEKLDEALPKSIISIHRTQNQQELAEIYTAADVLVNPTREEALGLVNVEALACGTPVITFRTGGSPETVDETSGVVVDVDNVDMMLDAIHDVVDNKKFSAEACIERSKQFNQQERYREYLEIYESKAKA